MKEKKQYDKEYKIQAVKLAKEITPPKAAKELGISVNTIYGWIRATRNGNLDLGPGFHNPQDALSLTEQLITLRKQVKIQAKEIKHLKETNDFLEEASAFFAASRLKSANHYE